MYSSRGPALLMPCTQRDIMRRPRRHLLQQGLSHHCNAPEYRRRILQQTPACQSYSVPGLHGRPDSAYYNHPPASSLPTPPISNAAYHYNAKSILQRRLLPPPPQSAKPRSLITNSAYFHPRPSQQQPPPRQIIGIGLAQTASLP